MSVTQEAVYFMVFGRCLHCKQETRTPRCHACESAQHARIQRVLGIKPPHSSDSIFSPPEPLK